MSKARERQQRRQQRQQQVSATSSPRRKLAAQLSPSGGFRFDTASLRQLRPVLAGVGAVVFMALVVVAVGLFAEDPPERTPNGIWLGSEWTYTRHEDDAVRDFVDQLRRHGIGTAYAHVSELNLDGSWTGKPDGLNRFAEVESEVGAFAVQFKRLYPEATLYGNLIFRIDLGDDGYRLDEGTLHQAIAEFAVRVVDTLGFDGVSIQVDPFVPNGDRNFLALLRQVRQTLGDDPLMAVVASPDWTPADSDVPATTLLSPGTAWDNEYKQRVALIQMDQIVVRAYNSYMISINGYDASDYAAWMAHQVRSFMDAILNLQTDTRLMIAVSTGNNIPNARDVLVEGIPAAASGVRQGLSGFDEEEVAVFQGIAVYEAETTSDEEWSVFKENWID